MLGCNSSKRDRWDSPGTVWAGPRWQVVSPGGVAAGSGASALTDATGLAIRFFVVEGAAGISTSGFLIPLMVRSRDFDTVVVLCRGVGGVESEGRRIPAPMVPPSGFLPIASTASPPTALLQRQSARAWPASTRGASSNLVPRPVEGSAPVHRPSSQSLLMACSWGTHGPSPL